jgi:hypothetical protein
MVDPFIGHNLDDKVMTPQGHPRPHHLRPRHRRREMSPGNAVSPRMEARMPRP